MYKIEDGPTLSPEPYDPMFHSKVTEVGLIVGAVALGAEGVDSIVENYQCGMGISVVATSLVILLASRAVRYGRQHSDYSSVDNRGEV